MAENEEWSTNANDAVKLALVHAGAQDLTEEHAFQPRFTYPIFGDEEVIFGYRGLSIDFRFASHDLQTNVEISYDQQFKAVGETQALDVKAELQKWLPEEAFVDSEAFAASLKKDGEQGHAFTPPGELVKSYKIGSQDFEIWKGSFSDPGVKKLMKRMQFFVPLFIEAGTCISLDDPKWTVDRWRVFCIYSREKGTAASAAPIYSFAGFCTTYRNFVIDPSAAKTSIDVDGEVPLPKEQVPSPDSLPCRERISQFLILPPYQGKGHGSRLYRTVYSSLLADPTVIEITVEDPSEAFDDLRDYCDLQHLRTLPEYTAIDIDTSVTISKKGTLPTATLLPIVKLQKIRTAQKIAPRQFDRVTEMHLLDLIPASSRGSSYSSAAINILRQRHNTDTNDADKKYRMWQLLVKQRLYKRNKDVLLQLERLERIDKLDQTRASQEDDYVRLLMNLRKGPATHDREVAEEKKEEAERAERASQLSQVRAERAKKRTVLDDDDDDDAASEDSRASKRPKV